MTQAAISFRLIPLRFQLETTSTFGAPEFKGALFRGGFGKYFRELVCITRAPECGGCPHLVACPYSIVFETPVQKERFSVLRKYPNAPHPFVMTPPLDDRRRISPGTKLELAVTLIGENIRYLPHFIRVIEALGASGRFGGGFRVHSVTSGTHLVYDGRMRRLVGTPESWSSNPALRVEPKFLDIYAVTPLRMRTEGKYNHTPTFVEIMQALLRRIGLLEALYGNGEATDWQGTVHRVMEQVDRVETENADFEVYAWDRQSGRQGRRVPMDGVVGCWRVRGDFKEILPWLQIGEQVHVGSGTSMGMGKIQVIEVQP